MLKTITINTETHRVVPIEPTVEMLQAGQSSGKKFAWSYARCYQDMIAAAPEFNESQNFLTYEDWSEDDGDVIWYKFPIDEPPYIGSPLNSDWIEDYYTHWVPLSSASEGI